MTHKAKLIALALLIAFSIAAPSAHAQSANDAKIASLQAQIRALQAQILLLKGGASATPSTDTDSGVEVTRATASSDKPRISGTADGYKTLYVSVTEEGETKPAFGKTVKVSREKWSTRGTKKLDAGTYTVEVRTKRSSTEVLATETLTVGKVEKTSASRASSADGSFSVSLVPLLMGGTARAGQSVPVSYLKVVNTGKETATLRGVTLAQKGTAPTSVIQSLSIKDDKDGSQGQAAFGKGFVPTNSVFAPGQMKLFTIRAALDAGASQHLGKTLNLVVTGIEGGTKSSFPIPGTTWTIGY